MTEAKKIKNNSKLCKTSEKIHITYRSARGRFDRLINFSILENIKMIRDLQTNVHATFFAKMFHWIEKYIFSVKYILQEKCLLQSTKAQLCETVIKQSAGT